MTTHNITQADIDNLSINGRKPRVVREYRSADEVREALGQTHHVKTVAELAKARKALTQAICDVLGVTRREVKIPQAHLVLMSPAGVNLARWEQKQWEHVIAEQKANGIANFHLGIAPDIQRGVLAAWEAQR